VAQTSSDMRLDVIGIFSSSKRGVVINSFRSGTEGKLWTLCLDLHCASTKWLSSRRIVSLHSGS
jgi:hypothetical protein